jgi:DNA-binding CsgD family transcriptional regulator
MTEAGGASAGLPRPLALHNRMLTVRRTADQRRFNMALKQMLRADIGGRTIVPIGSEHFLTMIRDAIDERPVIVVIVADRGRDGQVSPQCLQQAFDLTAREAELAAILATGEPLQKAAARLEMSLPTARTHLRHIYQKTGVQTQSGLVALIAGCTFGRCMPQPSAQRLFVLYQRTLRVTY